MDFENCEKYLMNVDWNKPKKPVKFKFCMCVVMRHKFPALKHLPLRELSRVQLIELYDAHCALTKRWDGSTDSGSPYYSLRQSELSHDDAVKRIERFGL